MEVISTIILTALFFYGAALLMNAVAREEDKRKSRSEAAWEAAE